MKLVSLSMTALLTSVVIPFLLGLPEASLRMTTVRVFVAMATVGTEESPWTPARSMPNKAIDNVAWDANAGRCVGSNGNYLMGKEWEAACRSIAGSGFACADGKGKCYAAKSQVRGRC
ncbi:hypothetical protein BKA66DRAFT_552291 [Pyrenochaeta sp. MPI-SDFR-AT-0127]|nr:hypothetical protein BKA66DRAFT_552291 [Pyrenochaeta sp. MPI-SDFR-AT-0127]